MKFLNKIKSHVMYNLDSLLLLLCSGVLLLAEPKSSLLAHINSIPLLINKNKSYEQKKSKYYKFLKKTSILVWLTSSITNLSINYDSYTQLIYKKYALQKNPFSNDNNDNINNTITTSNQDINELCSNVLMNAIETNPYLKKEEKDYIKPIKQFFIDNQFLDYEKTYQNLNTFYIHDDIITKLKGWYQYNRKTSDNIIISAQIKQNPLANYQKNINIYNFDFIESDYIHELFHIIGGFDNNFFNEGMVSLLTKEYFFINENSDDAYTVQRLVTRIIIEIVGADTVLKAYSTNDFNLIKEKLNEINNNPEETDAFIEYLNKYKYTEDNVNTILNYIGSYINNLDIDTQSIIINYVTSLHLNKDLTNNFYYNSKYKNRETNSVIVNYKKVKQKAN